VTVNANLLSPAGLATYYGNGVDTIFVAIGTGTIPAGDYEIPADKSLVILEDGIDLAVSGRINALGTFRIGEKVTSITNNGIIVLTERDRTAARVDGPSSKIVNSTTGAVPLNVADFPTSDKGPVVFSSLSLDAAKLAALAAYANGPAKTVYIAGDLTTGVNFTGNPYLVVLGSMVVNADISLGILGTTGSNTEILGGLEIASGKKAASTATSLEFAALKGSGGTLELSGVVTDVDIDRGDGNINLTSATALTLAGSSNFGNTGTTAFTDTANVVTIGDTGVVEFAGPVSFGKALTLAYTSTGGAVTFRNTASLPTGEKITLANAANTITLGVNGGALAVATAAGGNIPILENKSPTVDAVLTPGAGATLEFILASKTITQDVQSITIDGVVTVAPDATYNVAANRSLILDTNAAIAGAGKVKAGLSEIVGGWTANTGAITITTTSVTNTTITGASTRSLIAGAGSSITVLATGTLTLGANTLINLQGSGSNTVGSIILEGHASTGGILSLTANTMVVQTGNTGSTSGASISGGILTAASLLSDGGTPDKLVSITGASTGALQAGTGDLVINSDTTVTP
jgi:hypothetical protein